MITIAPVNQPTQPHDPDNGPATTVIKSWKAPIVLGRTVLRDNGPSGGGASLLINAGAVTAEKLLVEAAATGILLEARAGAAEGSDTGSTRG